MTLSNGKKGPTSDSSSMGRLTSPLGLSITDTAGAAGGGGGGGGNDLRGTGVAEKELWFPEHQEGS